MFSSEFCEIFESSFLYRASPVPALTITFLALFLFLYAIQIAPAEHETLTTFRILQIHIHIRFTQSLFPYVAMMKLNQALHFSLFVKEIVTLLNYIRQINSNISEQNDSVVTRIFLYGDDSFYIEMIITEFSYCI